MWNYYSDEINDDANENNAANNRINNNKTITSKSFEYKIKLIRSMPNDNNPLDAEITTETKNNLDYLIDPTFRKITRLFVLSFKNGNDDPTRDFFDKYCMSLVEIKDFYAVINHFLISQ